MINKENIEEKLFDYFEGELSAAEMKNVEQFVQENPEYQSDFQAWEASYLPEEQFEYKHVDDLLVDEGKTKPGFFARWKSSLLLALLALGSTGTVYYSMKSDDGKQGVAEHQKAKQVRSVATKDGKSLVANGSSDNTKTQGEVFVNEGSVSTESISEKGRLTAEVEQKKRKAQGSPVKSHKKKSTTSSNGQFVGKKKGVLGKVKQKAVRGLANIKGMIAGDFKRKTDQEDHRSFELNPVDIKGVISSQDDYTSAPDLKKGKNKFEKYSKNEVSFANDKNPTVVLPGHNLISLNPANVGNAKGIRTSYLYNNQWPELSDNFTTHVVSVDAYVSALKGGVGVRLISDVMGHNKFTTKGAELVYSPKIKLIGNTTIEPAVSYGFSQKKVSWSQVKNNVLLDSRNGAVNLMVDSIPGQLGSSSSTYQNLGLGFLVNTDKFYFGFSCEHFLQPSYDLGGVSSSVQVAGRLVAHAGGSILPIKDRSDFVLSPAVQYINTGGYDDLWFSNVVELSSFFAGASYSVRNNAMLGIGYKTSHIKVSYNYGLSSPVIATTRGLASHQVGIVLLLSPAKQ